jgi:hypothetical protein
LVDVWEDLRVGDVVAVMDKGNVCLVTSGLAAGDYVQVLFNGVMGWVYYYNLEKVDD